MTAAGFDVHARSIDGAAVQVPTGELVRVRFDGGVEGPVEWLRSLPGPAQIAITRSWGDSVGSGTVAMEFRLLGRLEVLSGGRSLVVGGGKRRDAVGDLAVAFQ
jgi:hypothetical protein